MNFLSRTLIVLMAAMFFLSTSSLAEWGPWGNEEKKYRDQDEFVTSLPKMAGLSIVKFYQIFISPHLRDVKCNFTPSCSNYAYQSIDRWGGLLGSVMTFERLSRDHPFAWEEKYKVKDKRLYDPPEQNYLFNKKDLQN